MKINYLILLVFLVVIGCSPENSEIDPTNRLTINSITPSRARIGDTIKISGYRLDLIEELTLSNDKLLVHPNYEPITLYDHAFITHTKDEITMVIPLFSHEKMIISVNDVPDDNIDQTTVEYDLSGLIPIRHNFKNIKLIKVIDKKTAFIVSEGSMYKSTDGFYNWELISEANNNDIFFIVNEMKWYKVNHDGYKTSDIYYTEDGGISYSLENSISLPETRDYIRKIQYTSRNKGYFKTGRRNMYVIDGGSVKNIKEVYPDIENSQLEDRRINDFNIFDDNLLFIITSDYFIPSIRIENQNITFGDLDITLGPKFFDNIGYCFVNKILYKSLDRGNSWIKIKTFENWPESINFMDNQLGFVNVDDLKNPRYISQTTDGGVTWEKYSNPTSYHIGSIGDFSSTNGIIGEGGSLVKYIRR